MKNTLVFGTSLKRNRYSNKAVLALANNGIPVEGFGIVPGTVGKVQVKANLEHFQNIHTLTLYLGPERQKQYYMEIIGLQPKRVIFNPGTENPEFYELLKAAGIEVEVACTLVLLATGQY
ncbi:CoA-binding protein [Maribacter sp. 2307ULW6-5]|uniref:CoA-binding protein n=1 Tax=Maribacter sp. 2307ULW6-5 TaxID=3386275 RepID=UPI0039BD2F19